MPSPFTCNFRAAHFLLLRSTIRCPDCQRATRVQALALPPGHAALSEPDDGEPACWQTVSLPVVLSSIDYLDPDAAEFLAARGAQLQPPAVGRHGWRNRCEHCRIAIDEAVLHAEPGAAFMPRTAAEATALMLEQIGLPICAAAADASLDPPWFHDFLRG